MLWFFLGLFFDTLPFKEYWRDSLGKFLWEYKWFVLALLVVMYLRRWYERKETHLRIREVMRRPLPKSTKKKDA